jgi:hypothetical protein
MKLAAFIAEDMDGILGDWEEFARSVPEAHSMESKQVRNHAESILRAIAHDMAQPQTDVQSAAKSKGQSDAAWDSASETAAQEHASMRLGEGFSLPDLVSEYRAMRASVGAALQKDQECPPSTLIVPACPIESISRMIFSPAPH